MEMKVPSRQLGRAKLGLAAIGVTALGLTACTPTLTVSTIPIDPTPQVNVQALPGETSKVDPDTTIQIAATDGVLTNVSVTGPEGEVAGILSEDSTEWIATAGPLDYASTYTLTATGADSRGRTEVISSSFTTIEPEKFFKATATPSEGSEVGVGMPIKVTFNKKVDNKAEVESALVVRTSTPVLGAWSWVNSRQVEFRPKDLWPGNTQVQLEMNLTGVQARPGVFGKTDTIQNFRYRSSVVSVVDAATYTMDVYRDGELLKTIPITTGKAGFETRSGTKVLLSKERSRIMDAATGGTSTSDPEYYRVNAEYAMRLNYTGEFVHAAPWSIGSQGRANVSHGCVGMSTTNAQWWWNQNNVGDVVIVENTSRTQGNDGNGITVWNDPWSDWVARSASGPVFTKPLIVESNVDSATTAVG
jgi:lipoprotein-anchoring transpeptidase ErfK/SrfK